MSGPEIWPVIHVLDADQALRCAAIADACRCEGVMLISMHGADAELTSIAAIVAEKHPGLAIGVNYLSLKPTEAMSRNLYWGHAATWTDHQEFFAGQFSNEAAALIRNMQPGHKFFAAVSFKGQVRDPYPAASAKSAVRAGLIPTTSGAGTGIAPDVAKIRSIRGWLHPTDPLAIASGITPENVDAFAPLVSHILVSTGISRSFHEFDPDKLALLIRRAKEAK